MSDVRYFGVPNVHQRFKFISFFYSNYCLFKTLLLVVTSLFVVKVQHIPFFSVTVILYTVFNFISIIYHKYSRYGNSDHRILIYTVLDISFLLFLNYFITEPDYLLLPFFLFISVFISYRFSARNAVMLFLFIIIGIAISMVQSNNHLSFNTKILKVSISVFSLMLVFFATAYIRLLLKDKLELIWEKTLHFNDFNDNTNLLNEIRSALPAQVVVSFMEENGVYILQHAIKIIAPLSDPTSYSKDANFQLNNNFLEFLGIKDTLNEFTLSPRQIYCVTSLDNGSFCDKNLFDIFNIPFQKFFEKFELPPKQSSIIATRFHDGLTNKEHVILAVNRIKSSLNNHFQFEDFRKEDAIFLDVLSNGFTKSNERNLFWEIFNDGVSDEISVIDKDFNIKMINQKKLQYFKKSLDDVLGKKCYSVFHNLLERCDVCKTKDVFHEEREKYEPWERRFNHPVTGRFQVAKIHHKAINFNKNHNYSEAIETVQDYTFEYRSRQLRNFIIKIKEKDSFDEMVFADTVTQLFNQSGFPRCRFYKYNTTEQTFICLSASGYSKSTTPLKGMKIKCHTNSSKQTTNPPDIQRIINDFENTKDKSTIKPYIVCSLKHDNVNAKLSINHITDLEQKNDPTSSIQDIIKVDQFLYNNEFELDNFITEMTLAPIILRGKMLGILSIDAYDYVLKRELYSMHPEDCKHIYIMSTIVGYIWESAQKEEFENLIQILNHLIFGPIESIQHSISSLPTVFSKENVQEEVQDIIDNINYECNSIERIITEPKIVDIPKHLYDFKKVYINDIINKYIEILSKNEAVHYNKVFIKKYEVSLQLEVDIRKIEIVIYNLLMNAINYSPSDSAITIHVRDDGKYCCIDIKNDGSEVLESEEESLFKKYQRGYYQSKHPLGSGFGLFVSRVIVRNHSGDIVITSYKKPVTFTILLPKIK